MSRPRLVIIVFFATAVLLVTAWLRAASSRTFYIHRQMYVRQGRLKQQLWQKQLELENLVSPSTISDRIEKQLKTDPETHVSDQ